MFIECLIKVQFILNIPTEFLFSTYTFEKLTLGN